MLVAQEAPLPWLSGVGLCKGVAGRRGYWVNIGVKRGHSSLGRVLLLCIIEDGDK